MKETLFDNIYEIYKEELAALKPKSKKRKAKGYYNILKNGIGKNNYQIYCLVNPEGYVLKSSSDIKKLKLYAVLLNYKLTQSEILSADELEYFKDYMMRFITNDFKV